MSDVCVSILSECLNMFELRWGSQKNVRQKLGSFYWNSPVVNQHRWGTPTNYVAHVCRETIGVPHLC